MATKQRLAPPEPAPPPFDERGETVNLVLALWCGLAGGLIVALGGFDDPRPWHNAWVRLMTLGLTASAVGWALQSRRIALTRRLQLGAALSLVAHTLLLVGLSQAQLRLTKEIVRQDSPETLAVADASKPIEVVAVDQQRREDQRSDFDRPVASGSPQLQTDDQTREHAAPRSLDTPLEPLDAAPSPADLTPLPLETPPPVAPEITEVRAEPTMPEPAAALMDERLRQPLGLIAPVEAPASVPAAPAIAAQVDRLPQTPLSPAMPIPLASAPEIEQPQAIPLPPRREVSLPQLAMVAESERPTPRGPLAAPVELPPAAMAVPMVDVDLPSPNPSPRAPDRRVDWPRTPRPMAKAPSPLPAPTPDAVEPDRLAANALPTNRAAAMPSVPMPIAPRPRERPLAPVAMPRVVDAVAPPVADSPTSPPEIKRPAGGFAGLKRTRNWVGEGAASRLLPDTLAGAAAEMSTTQKRVGDDEQPSLLEPRPTAAPKDDSTSIAKRAIDAEATAAGAVQPAPLRSAAMAGDRQAFSDAPLAETTALAGEQDLAALAPSVAPGSGAGVGAQSAGSPGVPDSSPVAPSQRPAVAAPMASLANAAPFGPPRVSPDRGGSAGDRPSEPAKRPGAASARPASPDAAPDGFRLGGGPRQPRRSRGPRENTTPFELPPAATATPAERPARLAMRSPASAPRIAIVDDGSAPGIPTPNTPTPGVADLASASPAPLALPATLLPRASSPSSSSRASRPSVNGANRQPAAAFSKRGKRQEQQPGGGGEPAYKTEAAVELGLRFLAKLQQEDGRWSFGKLGALSLPAEEKPTAQADAAATGLALLSLLGAGYDHFDGPYREPVQRALDYLVSVQKPSGELFPEDREGTANAWQVARFYSHGIAAIALCEAYGMTGDPKLRRPAQRALDYIAETQVPRRGGWRYTPGLNADLSVTGWQLMALKSGELAGLRVDPATYDGIGRFLELCRERTGRRARFCYNPTAPPDDPRTGHGAKPGTVMTSVGLLMQLYLGERQESRRAAAGADHLLANLPMIADEKAGGPGAIARTSTLGNPLRDTYYWYYATQVMFHMGGAYQQAWNDALRPILLNSQVAAGPLAGSWDPLGETPDKWAAFGGRLYVTTMNLLSLEVEYRHLPLYARVKAD